MNYRTLSDVAIGAADTLIQTLLESPGSIAWSSHWLISKLDSGDNYDHYADEMKTAGGGRGEMDKGGEKKDPKMPYRRK